MRPEQLSGRGTDTCRGCGADGLVSVLDLGRQPLANELLTDEHAEHGAFPLHLRICRHCALGQVGEYVLPERIFGDYPYLSSVSSSWLAHAQAYAGQTRSRLELTEADLVVEIASNDGYLLKQFMALGVPVLGVEPARNVAAIARAAGVRTLPEFFGRDTARRLVAEHGHPRLVVANNVLAHVPDLDDFMGGLAVLCGPSTVVTVENPSFRTLLLETQFDTIYHEHYSYLSAHAVARLAERHGLHLTAVEALPTHGGSNRYWLAPGGGELDGSAASAVAGELEDGLLRPETWHDFAERSLGAVRGMSSWLSERRSRDARVVAYGAAAKGNTLLNAAAISAPDILAVADGSSQKQGKLLPGSRVPVVAPTALAEHRPTDVLVLPWNLIDEIEPLLRALVPGATVWTAVPTMEQRPRGA